jgi:hypothetical protein
VRINCKGVPSFSDAGQAIESRISSTLAIGAWSMSRTPPTAYIYCSTETGGENTVFRVRL